MMRSNGKTVSFYCLLQKGHLMRFWGCNAATMTPTAVPSALCLFITFLTITIWNTYTTTLPLKNLATGKKNPSLLSVTFEIYFNQDY